MRTRWRAAAAMLGPALLSACAGYTWNGTAFVAPTTTQTRRWFEQPILDGRDDRAELLDWYLEEYNGKCVPIFDVGDFERCNAALEKNYHRVEAQRGLPYRSLSEDIVPKYPPESLPLPPPLTTTDCDPNPLGGGFSCTSY
jgi:hypothetical protein